MRFHSPAGWHCLFVGARNAYSEPVNREQRGREGEVERSFHWRIKPWVGACPGNCPQTRQIAPRYTRARRKGKSNVAPLGGRREPESKQGSAGSNCSIGVFLWQPNLVH
jgi:hypothetical protein